MYYELSTIKTYHRKKKNEDEVKSYNQINLGYFSKFKKDDPVTIIHENDFQQLMLDNEKSENESQLLQSKLDELTKRIDADSTQLDNYAAMIDELNSKVDELSKENEKYSIKLKDLANVKDENEKLRTIIANKKADISDKEKDLKTYYGYTLALTTAIAELNSRGFLDRMFNKKPETYAAIMEKIPNDVLLDGDDSGIEVPKFQKDGE